MVNNIVLYILLFCYVFAFFIGPVSISLLIAVPLYGVAILKMEYQKTIMLVFRSQLIRSIQYVWLMLLTMSIVYPIVYFTLDFSFLKIVIAQLFHLLAAVPFFAYLKYNSFSQSHIEKCFVTIFVIQTIIQVIVFSNPYLGELIILFNHFDTEKVIGIGSNVRGKALSAATTYHLSLAYGICFIIYIKQILSKKVSVINVLIGILIFVGIFFAGRTGFVGCIVGLLGFFIYHERGQHKLFLVIKIICIIIFLLFVLNIVLVVYAPDLYENIFNNVLPYAFEFLDNMDQSGSMETRSTNRLKEMWSSNFSALEMIIGSGYFTGKDGAYYMHVDPGILRVPLFSGILGYFLVWIYQLKLFPIKKFNGRTRFYSILILIYIAIMDFKGLTVGLNKFAFSITLLLSFVYLYLPDISITNYMGKKTNNKL